MKTQWRVMFFACCLAILLLPVTAMSAGLPEDAESALTAVPAQAPNPTQADDYENAADYWTYGDSEFFCDYEDEDKLYLLDKVSGDTRLVADEHIISLLGGGNSLYAFAYREGSTCLLRVNPADLTVTEYETLPGVVMSAARRGDTVYFAADDGVMSLNLDTRAKSLFLAADGVATLYFSDFDTLKFYTKNGLANAYSFAENALVPEDNADEQATLLDGGYVPRLEAPAKDNPYYTTLNVFHQSGFGMVTNNGNCTCYAFGRSYENLGVEPKLSHRNAGLWYGDNQNSNAYPYSANVSNPALGAVVVWSKSGAAGHVAVVEKIDGNTVTTSESGWKSFYFKTRARDATNSNLSGGSAYTFLGYIYVCGAPPYHVPGYYQVTASSLRMRSGAGTTYQQTGSIPNGAKLNVTKKTVSGKYTWGYVSYNGAEGWVALNYCERIGETVDEYYLNVSGYLDGKMSDSFGGYGTADVYANGNLVADDISAYSVRWPVGTTYELRDIRPKDGYSYNGMRFGARRGTVGNETVELRFDFSAIPAGNMTPEAETTFQGNTYRLYSDAATWYEAKRFCEEQGGHLLSIGNAKEAKAARTFADGRQVWTGGTDADSEGNWRWVSGETFSYDNWASYQPDNDADNEAGCENYLYLDKNGAWNDGAGYIKLPFICEIEALPIPTLTGISIESPPSKTVYAIGDALDISGLQIRADYSDGTSELLNDEFSISGFDSSADGVKTVTVAYQAKTVSFSVTVNPATPPDTFTVTFDSDGGSAVKNQTVQDGATAQKPDNPSKTGFVFDCWKLDGEEYDFHASVMRDITLVANWISQEDADSQVLIIGVSQNIDANGNVNVQSSVQCPDVSATVFCAAYGENGQMLLARSSPVTETQSYEFQFRDSRFSYAKVFVLDKDLTPLCEGKYS